jgi:addiction module HigA family antidote
MPPERGGRLDNVHPGEMLLSEFMEPLDLSVEQLATFIAVSPDRLVAVIDGERPVDGELDCGWAAISA